MNMTPNEVVTKVKRKQRDAKNLAQITIIADLVNRIQMLIKLLVIVQLHQIPMIVMEMELRMQMK